VSGKDIQKKSSKFYLLQSSSFYVLHASGSRTQDLRLRVEWLLPSSSAEEKERPKSTRNVNHICKSNSASYEHNSQYKVVMMQTIESGLCFFHPTDVTYAPG